MQLYLVHLDFTSEIEVSSDCILQSFVHPVGGSSYASERIRAAKESWLSKSWHMRSHNENRSQNHFEIQIDEFNDSVSISPRGLDITM